MMTNERWQQLKSLCHRALECDPREREAFLSGACGNDADLLRDVKALLEQATQAPGILDAPVWQALGIGANDSIPTERSPRPPGESAGIGRYRNLQRIGRGGMGTVYRAFDPLIGRTVAIKVLLVDDPELRARFLQEVHVAGTLTHQHVVAIYDYGESQGRPFIVMEYVEGRTLAERLRDALPLTLPEKVRLIEQLCAALDYAHACGVVHRDIKPANLMLDRRGDLKVVDFGIAKLGEGHLTRTGDVLGTLMYMSPEQVNGEAVDRRSDVFAVGAVIYEILSSRRAFQGDTPSQLIRAILHQQPPALTHLLPDLDPQWDRVVQTALRKDPAQRYQTLGQLAADVPRIRPAPARADRRRVVPAMAFALCLAVGAGIWLAIAALNGPTVSDKPATGVQPPIADTKAIDPSPPVVETLPPQLTDGNDGSSKRKPKPTIERVVTTPPTLTEQALALLAGTPTREQKAAAAELLEKACEERDSAACLRAGLLYRDEGPLRSLPMAAQMFQRACDAGSAEGCNLTGAEYQRGVAVAKDDVRAASFFVRACDGGWAPACTSLGRAFQAGRGVPQDLSRARALFQQACDRGGMIGCVDAGAMMIRGNGGAPDKAKAVAAFQKACDAGVIPGCANLAGVYYRGDGVPRDDGRAVELFQRACDGGGAPACFYLAGMYTDGRGVTKDLARAAALLERSCDGSYADACQTLSQRFEQGVGVERNAARAAELARRATQLRGSQTTAP